MPTSRDKPIQCSTRLVGREVPYTLVRARRASISMQISSSGLTVRAPVRTALREIDSVLVERGQWIVEKLTEWRAGMRHVENQWRDGGSFLLEGERVRLKVERSFFPGVTRARKEWLIALPPQASIDAGAIHKVMTKELKSMAEAMLVPLAHEYAKDVGAKLRKVSINDPRTQWGSCNSDREIRFSWRLIQLPPELAHYIVAHEVSHLIEMNHSPRFWALNGKLDPDYKKHRDVIARFSPLLDNDR